MRCATMLFFFGGFLSLCTAACAEPLVFDFESGDLGKEGWKILEGDNTKPVGSRDIEFHSTTRKYAKQGKFYLTTLESTANENPTDEVVCVLESPVFLIDGEDARLLLGGGNRKGTCVRLCPVAEDGKVGPPVREARGENTQELKETVWKTGDLKGKPFVLQLVDKETGAWAHLRMDDFRAEGKIDAEKTAIRDRYIASVIQTERAARKARLDAAKRNPLLLAQPILYTTRNQYKPDHHNTETLFQTGEINTEKFEGGSSLRVWNPADGSVRVLLEVPEGIVRDPCLSFDAKKVLLSIRRDIHDDYHLYEYALWEQGAGNRKLEGKEEGAPLVLEADTDLSGTPLTQLTFLPGVSDIDPLYLPNGQIVFSATREPKFCMCNRHIMGNLYKMEADGANIRQIGKSTLFEGHAALTPDGRIIYDRWEYVDRNFGDAQGVWITSPEGFNHAIFWGNNTASPGGVLDARIVPGSDSIFVATFSSCHDRPWGAIALVDRRLGIDGKQAVLQTWPANVIDLVDVGGYDTFIQVQPKMEDPFPLSNEWFLASGMTGTGERMGIYLLGRDGTMALVFDDPDVPGCYDPTPLAETVPPPVVAQETDYANPNGTLYVSNVYEGFGMDKVAKGAAKYLRVVESPEKRTWTHQSWDNGTGTQAPGMAWKDFNNKRVLGTVPIEEDGSVSVEVPADTFVYLQLLDEQGRMIQTMRSGMIVRPGETNGCYGCHEDRLATFPPLPYTPKAVSKPPRSLGGWYGGKPRLFSYVKEVQEPVFDKYCVACHDYGKIDAADKPNMPNLAGDLNVLFNTSYVELYRRGLISAVGAGPAKKLEPYSWGSTKSRLVEVLLNGHAEREIDEKRKELGLYIDRSTNPEAVGRVITWIDINAPYYGTYETSFPENRYGRCPLPDGKLNRLAELTGLNPGELDWNVSFTRPEISPCLSKWQTETDRKSPEYREALAIIAEGKAALEKTPRGEDPDAVAPAPDDLRQLEKHDRLQSRERRVREAILSGGKVYDR